MLPGDVKILYFSSLGCSVLAVSRIISLETVVHVFVEELVELDAVKLFCDLSGVSRCKAMYEICNSVGCLPLAIEIAAQLVKIGKVNLSDLNEKINASLHSLQFEDESKIKRHRSINACFQASYDTLSESAKEIFSQTSVLPGGVSPLLIKAVWENNMDNAKGELMRGRLWRLVGDAGDRYALHPLIRQFAMSKLENNSQVEDDIGTVFAKLVLQKGHESQV